MRSNRGAFGLTVGRLLLSGAVQAQIGGGYIAPLRLTSSVASTTNGAFDGTSTGLNGVGVSGTGGSGTADERGRYLHPVEMGAPASLSVDRTKGAAIP